MEDKDFELMQTSVAKGNKMGHMSMNKLLLTIALPIVVSMLVQALYNIVDSIFVAKISENALTAVSLAFPVQSLMIAIAVGTGVGSNALLSKSLGEKNFEKANKTAGNSIILALISSLVIVVLGFFFSKYYFIMQTDVPEIIEMGTSYTQIVCVVSIGLFVQIAFERILQSTGKTLLSMMMQLSGAIVNIVLDPILIFGYFGMPKMGVKGAAIATVIGQLVAMLVGITLHFAYNKEIKIKISDLKLSKVIVKQIYQVGVPSILMSSIMAVMVFVFNQILMKFNQVQDGLGVTATAILGVYFKLQSFVFMPVFGLNNGLVPIVAYNYGAQSRERIVKAIKLGMVYAIAMMLIGFVIFQAMPNLLLKMFDASDNMMLYGTKAMRIISISFLFAGFNIICCSVYQALGKSFRSLIISILRQLVIILPVAFLLSLSKNVDLVWWSIPIAEVACVPLCIVFLQNVMKKLKFHEGDLPAVLAESAVEEIDCNQKSDSQGNE